MIFNVHGHTAKQIGDSGARNLIPYPHFNTTREINGITFTDNGDGTIHVKGTATANASYAIRATSENWTLSKGKYVLKGCPSGGSFNTYRLQIARFIDGTLTSYANEYGNGAAVNITDDLPLLLQFVVSSGVTIDATVKPMLERGTVSHDYVPYYFGGAEKAKTAESAVNATHATSADSAKNANTIEGYLIRQLYKQNRILTHADDMNMLFELGMYYYTSSDIPQNAPYQNASFVEVIRFNDNRQIQRVTRAGVSGYQTERVYSGTWQEWAYDINDKNFNQYAMPLKGGGTIAFDNYTDFKVKRNNDNDSAGVGITFCNNKGTVGMLVFKNKKFYRVDTGTWGENEVLDTSNSAKVVISESAPSDNTALWVY